MSVNSKQYAPDLNQLKKSPTYIHFSFETYSYNTEISFIKGIMILNACVCIYWGGRVVRRCWANFQCRGVLLIWLIVGQGPNALAVSAGGGCFDIFLSSVFSHFFLPLLERPDID